MPRVTESIRLTNKEALPEELAAFKGFGKDERGHLVGIYEDDDKTKTVQNLSDLLMKTLVELGVAEEVTGGEISPVAQAIIDRLEQQNSLLEAQVTTLETEKAELEARLTQYDERFESLEGQLSDLQRSLEDRDREIDGFRIGEAVALLVEAQDEEYELGYTVSGFSAENEHGILIKNSETEEEIEVPSARLAHEDELEDEELDPEPIEGRPGRFGRWSPNQALGRGMTNWMTRRTTTVTEYDDSGRPVNETTERRGAGLAAAIGVGAVLGGLAIEIYEHKIMGHSTSRELRQITQNHIAEMKAINAHEHADKLRDAAQHKAEMTAIHNLDLQEKAAHTSEIKAINAHEHADFLRARHAHKHDLDAINGVLKAVNKDHHTLLEHAGIYGTPTGHSGDFSGYSTPWDYTHNESQLHIWASKAAAGGHKIRWIPIGSGKEMLEVDGTTNTQRVLQVVTQYR